MHSHLIYTICLNSILLMSLLPTPLVPTNEKLLAWVGDVPLVHGINITCMQLKEVLFFNFVFPWFFISYFQLF